MIESLIYKNEELSYPLFEFIYPELIKLVWRGKLGHKPKSKIVIPDRSKELVVSILNKKMMELLDEFYVKANHKYLSKYPGRIETIILNHQKYHLDIATNPKDRTVYQIWNISDWLNQIDKLN